MTKIDETCAAIAVDRAAGSAYPMLAVPPSASWGELRPQHAELPVSTPVTQATPAIVTRMRAEGGERARKSTVFSVQFDQFDQFVQFDPGFTVWRSPA